MTKYIYPVICVIGFSGNFLTILILNQKRNRKNSTAVFLIVLAVSDSIVLFEGYFCVVISNILQIDFHAINNISCKIHIFLTYFSLQYSSWILVLVTSERVVSVVKPYKARIICSRSGDLPCIHRDNFSYLEFSLDIWNGRSASSRFRQRLHLYTRKIYGICPQHMDKS